MDQINTILPKNKSVLIIETWFTRNPWHLILKYYLEHKGFRVYIFNHSIIKGSFEKGAKNLSSYIDRHNLKDLTIVGMSMGAVTALYYLQYLHGWSKTKALISLAAPFRGSVLSATFSFLKAGQEMLPNSRFTQKLLQEPLYHPERITCVVAKLDEMVPRQSSFIEGTQLKTMNIIGHNNLHIHAKEVYQLIIQKASQ